MAQPPHLRRSAQLATPGARVVRSALGFTTSTVPWSLLIAGAVLAFQVSECGNAEPDCAAVARAGNDGVIIAVCQREYARTGSPRAGVQLASSLRRSGDRTTAAAIARSLLASSAQADAFYVLGKIAASERRLEDASSALQIATALHREQRRWREAAKDLLAAAEVVTAREDFSQGLVLLDDCVSEARRAADPATEGYCHVAAARVLGKLGYGQGARQEHARAAALMAAPIHQPWLLLEEGNLHRDLGDHAQAILAFERALHSAEDRSMTRMAISAHLNLSEALLQRREWAAAERHLDHAAILDVEHDKDSDALALRAELQLGRGQLAAAEELAAQAHAAASPGAHDDLLDLTTLRARIALSAGDLAKAEEWARQAIAHAEAVRARQPLLQLRSWAMDHRREPYDLLFLSLVRRGLTEAALRAFDRWRSVAVMDHHPLSDHALQPSAGLHRLAQSARLRQADGTGVAEREVGRPGRAATPSVLALVVARDELWRITVDEHGRFEQASLGARSAWTARLDAFRTAPTDPAIAAELGATLVPKALARPDRRPLRVVLDEPLALLPISMLRVGAQRLVAIRPVVQLQRPLDDACASLTEAPTRVIVLADAADDLPEARREAARLARLALPVVDAHGAAATKEALLAARRSDLLHLAVHTEVDELGGALRLRDARVSALDVAALRQVPARVVLATCDSAVARGGTYSLAMAFLAAGAEQVIATLRPIGDRDAARLSERLYRDGEADLVSALARAQADADAPGDLAYFTVFGRPVCEPRAP
ncbi:MAG: CHAT domain-containing protein [Kofleriaceae bacterium]